MLDGVATSYIVDNNKVVLTLANGKSIEYPNAKVSIEKRRINTFRSIIGVLFFSFVAASIIIYLPPWRIYYLPRGLEFALSLALFAILAASLYSLYVSIDSLRRREVLVVEVDGKVYTYLYSRKL
ncbi:MAG: hypothetical protein F7B11_00010 [Caldisphaeraceae archaeon]|nr:hypothetical protein [Caldisphaeraceae archaeon]